MTHPGGLADRRRPTRANHRQTTLGAWPRSKLEANAAAVLASGLEALSWKHFGSSWKLSGDLESALEAID